MGTVAKSLALLFGVMAAALLVAFETMAPAAEPAAASQVAQRFPLSTETFTAVPITTFVAKKIIAAQKVSAAERDRRPPASQFCAMTPHGWPYTSHECRVAAGRVTSMES